MNTLSLETACYRIRRHSSQVGEGKATAHALLAALKSSDCRIVEIKAKKALPENRNQFCPEHWEVRVRFHSFADKAEGNKIAAPFLVETFVPASVIAAARIEADKPAQMPECSVCRRRHGNEIIHPCE